MELFLTARQAGCYSPTHFIIALRLQVPLDHHLQHCLAMPRLVHQVAVRQPPGSIHLLQLHLLARQPLVLLLHWLERAHFRPYQADLRFLPGFAPYADHRCLDLRVRPLSRHWELNLLMPP